MSEEHREPEMTVSFQVAYEGDGDLHAMDVQELAPALLGLGEIIREANAYFNAGKAAVNLNVVSDFEHKCFNIHFDLIMSLYTEVKAFLQLDDVVTAQNLMHWLELLGVSTGGVGGLLGYLRIRRGRRIKSVTRLADADKRGRVSVEFADTGAPQHIEVHQHVYQLGENKNVLRATSRVLRPIEDGAGYNRIEVKRGESKRIITQAEAKDIEKTCELALAQPEPSKPQTVDAVLQILGPVYDLGAQNWRFWYGETAITADISETDIAARALARGGVAVRDSYKVQLEITQHVTPTGQVRNSYKVKEIEDFIPAQPTEDGQTDLFTYLNRSADS